MGTAPVGQLVELARLADEVGYRRCWVYDEGLATRDVYVTLAAIATATDQILIGPGVTNPYVRHPGATATAIATLDELSGGRAFLGLGAGGGLTLTPLGIDRHRPLSTVAAMIADLRRLWAGERVTSDNGAYSLDGARLGYGRDDIEIIIAGRGPKMLDLGARAADGFYLGYIHKSLLADAVAELRAGAAAGGRPGPFTITYSTMLARTAADIEGARAQLTFRLVDSPPEVRDLLGMTDDQVAAVRAGLAEGGPSAAAEHIDPAWVGDFVIDATDGDVGPRLRSLLAEGDVDEFQLPVTDIDTAAALIENVAATIRS
ncbi:MAG: LLM class flavin-dependent oxidoreductase [Acidimicrobiales bacterium]